MATPRTVASLQAAYYLLTGILPFVSRRRFEAITGPKTEWWLVLTLGSEITVVGAVLGLAATREPDTSEVRLLGAGSAAALGAMDVIYVARRRISPVYLLDAMTQAAVLAGWLLRKPAGSGRTSSTAPPR